MVNEDDSSSLECENSDSDESLEDKNPNRNMSLGEFVLLGDKDSLIDYLRKFKVSESKCPPTGLLCAVSNQCYYCIECFKLCFDRCCEGR